MKAKQLIKSSIKSIKGTIKMYEDWAKRDRKKLIELEQALEELE